MARVARLRAGAGCPQLSVCTNEWTGARFAWAQRGRRWVLGTWGEQVQARRLGNDFPASALWFSVPLICSGSG